MGSKSQAPTAPDMSGIAKAAQDAANNSYNLGQQQLDWAKQQYAQNQGQISDITSKMLAASAAEFPGQQQQYQQLADQQSGLAKNALAIGDQANNFANQQNNNQQQQLGYESDQLGNQQQQLALQQQQLGYQQDQFGLQAQQQAQANQLYGQYQNVYQPAQQQFLTDANNYDSAGREDQQAGAAQAQVAQNYDAARNSATQQLESFGVNPASTRYAALDIGTRAQQAADMAAAGNNSRVNTQNTGLGLRAQAIGMGANLPSQANAAANTGATYGGLANSFGNTANAYGNTGVSYGSLANSFGNTGVSYANSANNALGLNNSAVNTASNAYNGATNAVNGNTSAITSAAGIAGNAANALNSTFATGASAMGNPTSYLSSGNQALNSWGNTVNQGYQQQLDQFKADQSASSGIGSALGTAAGLGMKIAGFAGGGMVPELHAAGGGAIPMGASPSRGAVTDDIPARLNAGEFVVPKDVASWLGEKTLQQTIMKARQERQGAVAKPAIGPAAPQPQQGAIPMRAAA